MAIHRHEPIDEKQMNTIGPDNTICETLRKAYRSIKAVEDDHNKNGYACEDLKDAMFGLRIATSMAKAMTAKLEDYKRNWRRGFWDENPLYLTKVRRKAPIDVLLISWDDNSNTMYRFWQCARYLGLNSVMVKGKQHPFYPFQAPLHPSLYGPPISYSPIMVPASGLESLINNSHIIHLGASTYPMCAVNWANRHVVVQHGGTVYRQNPGMANDIFNKIAKKTIIQCPDLLGLGADNENWIYYPVDTVKIQPDYSPKGDRPVIGHFPSNANVKGTELIENILNSLKADGFKFDYIGSTEIIPWAQNLERMAKCDIIIESLSPMQGDKVYGEWGNTALEASALGCVVVSQCAHHDLYKKEFGINPGFIVANSKLDLEASLTELLQMDDLTPLKKQCRKWAEDNHSIPVTANRLWDLVYKDFF